MTLCSSAPTPDSRPDTSVVSAKEDSLLSASGPNGQAGAYQSGNYRWVRRVRAHFWRQGWMYTVDVCRVEHTAGWLRCCCTILQQRRLQS